MSKEEIIKELERLKKDSNEYSNYALMNEDYRVAIMDAMDLVKKLNIPDIVGQSEQLSLCKCDKPSPDIMYGETCTECCLQIDPKA